MTRTEVAVVALLFGVALGGWLMVLIGRWMDRHAGEDHIAEMGGAKAEAWNGGYESGYADGLGIQAEINVPQRKER